MPPGDINEQNTRVKEGEKSAKDIDRHVDQWITKNSDKWNGWLAEARARLDDDHLYHLNESLRILIESMLPEISTSPPQEDVSQGRR